MVSYMYALLGCWNDTSGMPSGIPLCRRLNQVSYIRREFSLLEENSHSHSNLEFAENGNWNLGYPIVLLLCYLNKVSGGIKCYYLSISHME